MENIIAGIDSSAVIVEDTGKVKKKKNKNKRILKQEEVVKSEAELKMRAEALIVKEIEKKPDTIVDKTKSKLGWLFNTSN